MPGPLVLYALCGSLRKVSTNRALLEALRDIAPPDISVEICDLIGDLPIFNPDREGDDMPASVLALAAKIRAADGLDHRLTGICPWHSRRVEECARLAGLPR